METSSSSFGYKWEEASLLRSRLSHSFPIKVTHEKRLLPRAKNTFLIYIDYFSNGTDAALLNFAL